MRIEGKSAKDIFNEIVKLTEDYKTNNSEIGQLLTDYPEVYHEKDKENNNILHIFAHSLWLDEDLFKLLIERLEQKNLLANYINAANNNGKTPLFVARSGSNLTLLIDKGADITRINSDNMNILHSAILYGKLDLLPLLIENLSKKNLLMEYINAKTKYGHTPLLKLLSCCSYYNKDKIIEMTKLLIKHGADIYIHYEDNDNILHYVRSDGNAYEIFKILIEKFKQDNKLEYFINAQDKYGSTPLCNAFNINPEIMPLLIENGANIKLALSNIEKYKSVIFYENDADKKAHENERNRKIEFLKKKEKEIDAQKFDEIIILIQESNKLDEIKLLLKENPDFLYKKDSNDNNLLHIAALNKNSAILQFLVENLEKNGQLNYYINAQNKLGQTPLHNIVIAADVENAEFLIKNGAYTKSSDQTNNTPLDLATKYQNSRMIEMLKKLEKEEETLENAIYDQIYKLIFGDHKISDYTFEVKKLLEKHPNLIRKNDKDRRSILHLAAEKKHLKMMELLLQISKDNNIKLDIDATNHYEETALHLVYRKGNSSTFQECAKWLIAQGANINHKNIHGYTILHLIANNYPDNNFINYLYPCAEFLMSTGKLNLNLQTNEGKYTALQIAIKQKNLVFAKFLMENGADIYDDKEQNLFHLLIESGYYSTEIREILTEKLKKDGKLEAYINQKDQNGNSPLFLAISETNFEWVKFLVENGADLDVRNPKNQTPLDFAKNLFFYHPIIEFLEKKEKEKNDQLNEITQLVTTFKISTDNSYLITNIKNFLGNKSDSSFNKKVKNILDIFLSLDEIYKINIFLEIFEEMQIKLDITDISNNRLCLLAYITQVGDSKPRQLMQYTHEQKIDINEKDVNGNRILHFYSQRGDIEKITFLLYNGADIDAINDENQTALDLATQNNHQTIVRFLETKKEERKKLQSPNNNINNNLPPISVKTDPNGEKISSQNILPNLMQNTGNSNNINNNLPPISAKTDPNGEKIASQNILPNLTQNTDNSNNVSNNINNNLPPISAKTDPNGEKIASQNILPNLTQNTDNSNNVSNNINNNLPPISAKTDPNGEKIASQNILPNLTQNTGNSNNVSNNINNKDKIDENGKKSNKLISFFSKIKNFFANIITSFFTSLKKIFGNSNSENEKKTKLEQVPNQPNLLSKSAGTNQSRK